MSLEHAVPGVIRAILLTLVVGWMPCTDALAQSAPPADQKDREPTEVGDAPEVASEELPLPAIPDGPPGWLEILVFDGESGLPLGDIAVELLDQKMATDSSGRLRAESPSGQLQFRVGGFLVTDVVVGAGQTSEILVTLDPGLGLRTVEREQPDLETEDVSTELSEGVPGRLIGRVISSEDQRPIAGARIFVRGQPVEVETDSTGRFELEATQGEQVLSIVRTGFSTEVVEGVLITEEAGEEQVFKLLPAAPLYEFAVRAPRLAGGTSTLLSERKTSSAVSDVLSAEQMSAAGDSDAAGALKRVPGLTVVGGKYVYVRGLGERYSSTLLNGAGLPSPEPERRVVPLDLFPTSSLESVVIQKTFSPDRPAEFGGGVIQLRTRGVPEKPIAKFSISTGFRTGTTFQDAMVSPRGPTDTLGIDGGWRDLPAAVSEASDDEPLEEGDMFSDRGYTADELEVFGEEMPNRWNPEAEMTPPDGGFGVTLGRGWTPGEAKLGVLFGMGYGVSHKTRSYDKLYYTLGQAGELEESHRYRFNKSGRGVRLGGILCLGLSPNADHNFTSTTLVARKTDDSVRTYSGLNRDVDAEIEVTRLRFLERMLITQQFTGRHRFDVGEGPTIDWRYTFSVASRAEPDRREYRFDQEAEDLWLLSDRPEGNQRFFSDLRDEGHDVGGDFTLPFKQWSGLVARFKAGGSYLSKSRQVDTRRFKFMHKGPLAGDSDVLSGSPEEIFVPDNIGSDGFQFEEVTRQTDNYTAAQTIGAGYFLIDLPFTEWLRLMGGIRVEHGVQEVSTFELFNPDSTPVIADLVSTDVLPGVTVTLKPAESHLLRLGYGLTVSRPDFRELSPATFNDVTGGRQTFGNPDLDRARIHNVDLRWEWYPTPLESISAGLFYKKFEQPVETVVVVSAQHSVTWQNAESADNVGFEFDMRKDFAFVHPRLADLSFAANLSLIYSQVRIGESAGIQTSNQRALQGQSPFVVNLQLSYDNPDIGTRATLSYNVFGRRIEQVGALGAPDSFEEPFHQLDFAVKQKLRHGFSVGFKVKNMLDYTERRSQGDYETQRIKRGVQFGLSLSWDAAALAPKS
jgi:outer membrane receptor protein involved in Fe transport